MLIEQIIEFESRVPGPLVVHRGAESQTWARGQLKNAGFPVLWNPR